MKWRLYENLLFIPAIVIVVGGLIAYFYEPPMSVRDLVRSELQSIEDAPPVHELLAVNISPQIAKPEPDGSVELIIKTDSIRREQCDVILQRTFAKAVTHDVVYQITQRGGGVPATGKRETIPLYLKLPADKFGPGTYEYSAIAFNDCGGKPYIAKTPIVPFRVEP